MNAADIANTFLTMTIMSHAGEMSSMGDDKLKGLMEVAQHQWDALEAPDTILCVANICSNYKTAETGDLVKALRISETASMRAVMIYLIAAAGDYSIPPNIAIEYINDHEKIVMAVTTAIRHRMIQLWMGVPAEELVGTIKNRIEAGEGDDVFAAAGSLDPHMPPGTTIQ